MGITSSCLKVLHDWYIAIVHPKFLLCHVDKIPVLIQLVNCTFWILNCPFK